jgi:osmoprotectant transport system ATP-binding protein
MTSATPVIIYENVGKSFEHGRVKAVDDVSLKVEAGEFLAIVGGSGSGKTTLLRLANRLIAPDSGTVRVHGDDILDLDPIALRRSIGYVFQSGGLFPHMTVAGNIGITPRLLGIPAQEISARVDELIDLIRSNHHTAIAFRTNSGGQRQRRRCARVGCKASDCADGRAVRRARSPHPRCTWRGLSHSIATSG